MVGSGASQIKKPCDSCKRYLDHLDGKNQNVRSKNLILQDGRHSLSTHQCVDLSNANAISYKVFTYLILAAGVAAAELLYLAYNGDKEVTWSEACGVFGSFCRLARTSVAITFGTVLCFILLSLISSYCLFSAYEAPLSSALGSKGVEIAAYPR